MTERRSKYHAKPVEIDGIRFDSKAEGNRYAELKLLERAGEINNLTVHPRFEIIPAFERDGRKFRATFYEADFAYWSWTQGRAIIEDVKGVMTPVFRMKLKLFLSQYPNLAIDIVEAK